MKRRDERPLSLLPNLGPKSSRLLLEAGISTIAELAELGPAKAYVRVRQLSPKSVSRNLLWAIAAGLKDQDWRSLTPAEKEALLSAVARLRG